MPDCSGLFGPRGSRTHPNQKRDTPHTRLRSSTFHSFETPQEPKCSELKMICGRLYLHATTGSHLDDSSKYFSFWKSSSFHFFGPKKPKSRPQSTLSFSKNSIIFNDLLAGASEHKSEKFFLVFKLMINI